MGGHWLNSDASALTPSPSPEGRGGTSVVVRRFVEIVRGEAVHAPANAWHTEAVEARELYCLKCFGVRWHDVVLAWTREDGRPFEISFCRVCGEEVRYE